MLSISLADDMGYGDLSSLNPDSKIFTPHMDQVVREGIHFTDAHTNSAVCIPTRYGVLTGRYGSRTRLKKGVTRGFDDNVDYTQRVQGGPADHGFDHSLHGVFAIRKGKYTAHLGSGGFSTPSTIEPKKGEAPGTLYDMEVDPKEQNNVYFQHPEVVEELSQLLEQYKTQGYSRKSTNN